MRHIYCVPCGTYNVYGRTAALMCNLKSVYIGAVRTLGLKIRCIAYQLSVMFRMYIGAIGIMCGIFTVYTWEVCTLGQRVHWGSVYTEAVCTLRQCVH